MGKYVRLLRLEDQFFQSGAAFTAGIFLHLRSWSIVWWAVASTCISLTAYILNEVADRKDVDRYSWNPIHAAARDRLNLWIVGVVFAFFSLAGLGISMSLGYFWWGLAMYIIGILYSTPPIRLKRRVVLDIFSQLLIWWIIPFLTPVWGVANQSLTLTFVIVTSLAIWSVVFPYQIADFRADQKAGLLSTHVVLGIQKSLWLGALTGAAGIIFYGIFGVFRWAVWSIPPLFVVPFALYFYFQWLKTTSLSKQLSSMQRYVGIFKPLGLWVCLVYAVSVWIII